MKLVVEGVDAHDLMPRDGKGSASPFVEVDFQNQLSKTKSIPKNLNPVWNQKLLFDIDETKNRHHQSIEVSVYNERRPIPGRNFLGRTRIPCSNVVKKGDEVYQTFQLEKKWFFSSVKGEIGRKIYTSPESETKAPTLPSPSQPPPSNTLQPPESSFLLRKELKFSSPVHLRVCFAGGYHVMDESTMYISDQRPTARQLWKQPVGILEVGILGAQGILPVKMKDGRGSTDAYCVAKYGQKWVRIRTIVDTFNPKGMSNTLGKFTILDSDNIRSFRQLPFKRRYQAKNIVAVKLGRAEPPLRKEVVEYMLDVDSHMWSMRRSKANFFRIMSLVSGLFSMSHWFGDICQWRNPVTLVLVHILFLISIWYPESILPTLFLYMFLIGIWNYRGVAGRIQTVMGDIATQGERFQSAHLERS
ncbi:hypothetical protein DKX38_024848 [Salix brachista]|uniref:C2 domain-containing protein n=1 Tax=Salix brachista TaxID=2182728 RepID=A0A5N5JMR5_9ROSI|nr:hypothetical protein DKX38_024848 [Salix brachista]